MKQTSKGVLLFVLAFALILCLTLGVVALQFFWGGNEKSSPLPQVLGVVLTDSTLSGHWDEHGWMGDGTEYWQVELSQEDAAALEKTVQTREGWHPLPVNEDGEALIYGREWQEGTESFSAGPYLTGKDGKALLPQVEEGYWFFWNDQTHSPETAGVLGRGSYNFTAAVYDTSTRTLYCGELDT